MDELIIRSLQGRTTESEERDLRAWLRASPANRTRRRELARLWEMTGEAASPGSDRPVPTVDELLGESAPSPDQVIPSRRRARSPWLRRGAAIAASIVFGFVLAGVWSQLPTDSNVTSAEFITGASEMATARLNDGSVVRLAPNSRLRLSANAQSRDVWLDGKAFFSVSRDENRPFTVRTRAGEAHVLGTRFEVNVQQDDLRVVVVEGRVAHSSAGERVEVEAGEVSHASTGMRPSVSRPADIRPFLDWTGAFLAFESTPLRQAAREIEHRYNVRVEIPDSALAERTVTAWFTDESLDGVMAVVCRIADAHCAVGDSVVSIEP